MAPFQYLLGIVSILITLAIADILTSLHRLLRARQQVRWDWRPLVAALLVLLTVLEFSWKFYRLGRFEAWSRYGTFLLLMGHLVLMFLLACAALPDRTSDLLDLGVFYEENRRYFWTLFAIVTFSAIPVNLMAGYPGGAPPMLVINVLANLVTGGAMLSLAFVRARAYDASWIAILLLVMAVSWWHLGLQ